LVLRHQEGSRGDEKRRGDDGRSPESPRKDLGALEKEHGVFEGPRKASCLGVDDLRKEKKRKGFWFDEEKIREDQIREDQIGEDQRRSEKIRTGSLGLSLSRLSVL